MYITGSIETLESRIHQLVSMNQPTGDTFVSSALGDMVNFVTEAQSYLVGGTISNQQSGKWEREIRQRRYALSGDVSQMLVQQL
jgi:hypothetical protein